MYIVKKYSASGLWSGEPIESFDTAKDASDWLNQLADERESRGFDVSDERDAKDNVTWLEITHDDYADSFQYRVVFESDDSSLDDNEESA